MTAVGLSMDQLILTGACNALSRSVLAGRALALLSPVLADPIPSLPHEFILFSPSGERLGVIPAPAEQPCFGANRPTLYLRRERP